MLTFFRLKYFFAIMLAKIQKDLAVKTLQNFDIPVLLPIDNSILYK